MTGPVRLDSASLSATVDPGTGAVTGLRTADAAWSILDRAWLGRSFRLLVPLPDRRANYVDGLHQAPPRLDVADDAVTLRWETVRSEHGGEHPIGVRLTVAAVADRLVFGAEIDNHSELTVENVHYPFLGDVRPPDPGREFAALGQYGSGGSRTVLWPRFGNAPGFCSVEHPTYANVPANALGAVGVPATPFVLLDDGRTGLYLGVDEPSSELVAWHGELHPGWGDSLGSRVPPGRTVGGHDVALRFGAVHVPYVRPGESRRLTPIAVAAYTGDWHAGADRYARRRREWGMVDAPPPTWTRDPHAWQQIQLNSAEDSLRVPFDRLPEVAAECAARGVTVLQVTGWNDGGQDRNNPCHDPDPRLGGADALRRAIAECRRLGVRVVLFTKFVWADRATERFRDELAALAVRDPYGDHYVFPGFRYDTMTQLLDINTRRLVPMCFADERWLDVCADEFATVAALGADGMLNDEAMHHSPALLCFDPAHRHRPAAPVYAHDRDLARRLRAVDGARDPEFLFAAEACYDWLFETYQLAYLRSNSADHIPLSRYLHPHVPMMTAVTGFDDRTMINQCLLYRYLVSYEPYLFKGRLTDLDQTVQYGRCMDRLRTELREWFWDGTFADTVGATVTDAAGRPHRPYAVHTSARAAAPALAVANDDATATARLTVAIEGGAPAYRYRLVDDPTWHDAAAGVVVPPRGAAVVVPADSAK